MPAISETTSPSARTDRFRGPGISVEPMNLQYAHRPFAVDCEREVIRLFTAWRPGCVRMLSHAARLELPLACFNASAKWASVLSRVVASTSDFSFKRWRIAIRRQCARVPVGLPPMRAGTVRRVRRAQSALAVSDCIQGRTLTRNVVGSLPPTDHRTSYARGRPARAVKPSVVTMISAMPGNWLRFPS